MEGEVTLFTYATIITVDAEGTVWLDGTILVRGNTIEEIGKTASLLERNPKAKVVDCRNKIIIPGLINTHAHLGQSILRGLAEDIPLHSWLCDAIWPLEAHYEGDDGYNAARLTISEMLKSATTCFLEALLAPRIGFDNVVRAVDEMGIRGCLGKLVKVQDRGKTDTLADPRDRDLSSMSIEAALATHQTHNDSCEGRLQVWMAAVTPRGSAESAHKMIGDACAEHGIGLTMHCAEAPKDLLIYRHSYGCSPAEFCYRTNLIGEGRKTVLAHMVNVDLVKDLPLLRKTGATIAHNPSSNCKLGSGIAAVPEMLMENVNVGLGTDGAPCANTYDMILEMRMAALIQKGSRQNSAVMTAEQVLRLATINGAAALGVEKEIGSLEVGKKADFAVIDTSSLACAPFDSEQVLDGGMDPITLVVYSCTGADVDKVVIDGKMLVDQKRQVSGKEGQIREEALRSIKRIRKRSTIRSNVTRSYR